MKTEYSPVPIVTVCTIPKNKYILQICPNLSLEMNNKPNIFYRFFFKLLLGFEWRENK